MTGTWISVWPDIRDICPVDRVEEYSFWENKRYYFRDKDGNERMLDDGAGGQPRFKVSHSPDWGTFYQLWYPNPRTTTRFNHLTRKMEPVSVEADPRC